jgi:heterodisulfide reductase subunit A
VLGTEAVELRRAAAEADVRLVRFRDGEPPEVSTGGEGLSVRVRDILLDRELVLPADRVVLAAGFTGDETVEKLRGLLKVSSDEERFFKEAHIKLAPLDFPADGVYLAGCARSPKGLRETVEEGQGAAMRAAIPMIRGYVEAEGITAVVDPASCTGCGLCAKDCPFSAIEMKDDLPEVITAVCKGCGTCAAACPGDAIQIVHYTDEQLLAQVEACLGEEPGKKIVAFCCHWCAMGAVDIAGVSRMEYPPHVRIIRVMCSARVDKDHVLRALELGAAGVIVAGCEFPTCHYISGNADCKKRMDRLSRKLEKRGIDPGRLRTVWLSAAQGQKWVRTVEEYVRELGLK